MLKIRLQKVGKKNAPSYRIVLAEHTSPPQGKFIEILGHYNPRLKQKNFKKERIEHWLSKGAQASPTVHNLLIDAKIIEGEKLKTWKAKAKKALPTGGVPTETGKEPVEKPKEVESSQETSASDESTVDKKSAEEAERPEETLKEEEKKEEKIDPVRLSGDSQEIKKDNEKSNRVDKKEEID